MDLIRDHLPGQYSSAQLAEKLKVSKRMVGTYLAWLRDNGYLSLNPGSARRRLVISLVGDPRRPVEVPKR